MVHAGAVGKLVSLQIITRVGVPSMNDVWKLNLGDGGTSGILGAHVQ